MRRRTGRNDPGTSGARLHTWASRFDTSTLVFGRALLWGILMMGGLMACSSGDPPAVADSAPAVAPASTDGYPVVAIGTTHKLRVATFNASLYDPAGGLVERLRGDDTKAAKVAAIIQHVRPDLLLLNEFDYDPEGEALKLFRERYLGRGQHGQQPIEYAHAYAPPVNTGVPSGMDLNGDGRADGPNDAWGFGHHPGQYGMLVLSRYPIDRSALRSFQNLRWAGMPGARRPLHPDTGAPYHPDATWQQLRLSSKNHVDVPIDTPWGRLHALILHPTPPIFDGPEGLNRHRNFDEIRLIAEYIHGESSADWLVDDRGVAGRLEADASFVVLGDLNADPFDGASLPGAVQQVLEHPRVAPYPAPRSAAAAAEQRFGERGIHHTDPATDTARFNERAGNMRVDYVLPSADWQVIASAVFWPGSEEPGHAWLDASDHRMVWVDLAKPGMQLPDAQLPALNLPALPQPDRDASSGIGTPPSSD